MTIELSFLGVAVGILSGFFGIGGGTVSVPLLLYLGFGIKEAIGISLMQMVAGSLMAAWIHNKKKTYAIRDVKYFGYGGLIGAVIGGVLVKVLDAALLGWAFLAILGFTLVRLILSSPAPSRPEVVNRPLYGAIGSGIGIFSGMLGVGGAVLLTPILVSFMGFELKKASAIGLFFVIFTSVSALITLGILGMVNWQAGAIMAIASLAGIRAGIWLVHKIHLHYYKQVLVAFYIIIFSLAAIKIIAG
ncbi:MAG TPA: sulfite exporter TauE/SafE family protein [Sulfuricurvum sp.]|nr:sulfite exporter TauE/SafE family protein [Sulfuricurvum sp.]